MSHKTSYRAICCPPLCCGDTGQRSSRQAPNQPFRGGHLERTSNFGLRLLALLGLRRCVQAHPGVTATGLLLLALLVCLSGTARTAWSSTGDDDRSADASPPLMLGANRGAPALENPPSEEAIPPAPHLESTIRVIYTGNRMGIGSGRYRFEGLEKLRKAGKEHQISLEAAGTVHGILAQDGWLLSTTDFTMANVLQFLKGGQITCGASHALKAVLTGTDVTFLATQDQAQLKALEALFGDLSDYTRRECTNARGDVATLMGPEQAEGEPRWIAEAFEVRMGLTLWLAVQSQGVQALVVGRPIQEASRMFRRIRTLLEETPGTLYVDAGNAVDGVSSVMDGTLSLHRPLGYRMLQRLKPTALAPGRMELVAGPSKFFSEIRDMGLPYIATNWETENDALTLPEVKLVEVNAGAQTLRLAFVALLDPELHSWIPELAAEGVQITDPIAAVQRVLEGLAKEGRAPDAVFALTTGGAHLLERVRKEMRGVDLMAGDSTFATLRVLERQVGLRTLGRQTKGAPLTLAMDGVAEAELHFEGAGQTLAAVVVRPHLIGTDLPRDAAVTAGITRTRAATYPQLDHPLIPAGPEGPGQVMTQTTWEKVVCESLLEYAHGDLVMLGELPAVTRIPGPLTELQVVDQLSMLDVVEEHYVPGRVLPAMLNKAFGSVPIACGATVGSRYPKVRGRSVETDRSYRVLTTDRSRTNSPVGHILTGGYSTKTLDLPNYRVIRHPGGAPLTLRLAVLRSLRTLRNRLEDPMQLLEVLTSRSAKDKRPEWVLRIREISTRVEQFDGVKEGDFSAVPETLANSESTFTTGLQTDLALDYTSSSLAWDLRFRSAYTNLTVEDKVTEETEDDWKASSSAAAPQYPIRTGPFKFIPYGEVLYDSEFTPAEGAELRQADLQISLGLRSKKLGPITSLKLSGLVNQDLNKLSDKAPELGGQVEIGTLKVLGPSTRLSTRALLQVFGNTVDDDASDLRYLGLGEVRLGLPLSRALDVALYAQGLALKRRWLDEGEASTALGPGYSWNVGFSLDMWGVFALQGAPHQER